MYSQENINAIDLKAVRLLDTLNRNNAQFTETFLELVRTNTEPITFSNLVAAVKKNDQTKNVSQIVTYLSTDVDEGLFNSYEVFELGENPDDMFNFIATKSAFTVDDLKNAIIQNYLFSNATPDLGYTVLLAVLSVNQTESEVNE